MSAKAPQKRSPTAKPRLIEISEALGLSKTAVSRALRDMPDISEATRKRVKAYASKIGYRPNLAARSLATSRNHTIGVGMGAFANPFFQDVVYALLQETRAKEMSLSLLELAPDPVSGDLKLFPEGGGAIDALVVLEGWYERGLTADKLRDLDRNVAPTIYRGNLEGDDFDQIQVDWRSAAFDITRYLLRLGHRNIGILRGVGTTRLDTPPVPCQKTLGSLDACEQFDVPWDSVAIRRFPSHYANAKQAALELLLRKPRPTAIICHTDYLAVGAMRAAQDLGLRVPQDLSVTGFNNIELGAYLPVALTTVGHPIKEVGREIVQRVVSRINEGRPPESYRSRVPHELIIRESCQPPPADL